MPINRIMIHSSTIYKYRWQTDGDIENAKVIRLENVKSGVQVQVINPLGRELVAAMVIKSPVAVTCYVTDENTNKLFLTFSANADWVNVMVW